MIDHIVLAWRPEKGTDRRLVANIRRMIGENDRCLFQYNMAEVQLAQEKGFTCYPEFPKLSAESFQVPIEVFTRRLPPIKRVDAVFFYKLWEANRTEYDAFDRLALTQGQLPTDLFEFIGVFNFTHDFEFVTEVSASKHYPSFALIKTTTEIRLEPEPDNPKDENAVQVIANDIVIGYLKKVHNWAVSQAIKNGFRIRVQVKEIINGMQPKQVFLLIRFSKPRIQVPPHTILKPTMQNIIEKINDIENPLIFERLIQTLENIGSLGKLYKVFYESPSFFADQSLESRVRHLQTKRTSNYFYLLFEDKEKKYLVGYIKRIENSQNNGFIIKRYDSQYTYIKDFDEGHAEYFTFDGVSAYKIVEIRETIDGDAEFHLEKVDFNLTTNKLTT